MNRLAIVAAVALLVTVGTRLSTADAGGPDCARHPTNPNCQTTTTGATTSSTTTTSTIPPSTSTSTSTSSTSSTSTTTTTPAPTTTTPATTAPAGTQFSATFDTPADFFDRFQTYAGNFIDAQGHRTSDYIAQGGDTPRYTFGDHDLACESPDTLRQLDNADPDVSKYFYWCAPGGPATGHVMTALDTSGYAIMSFSPKQSFTDVSQVCWDINATEEGGGKWTFLTIVPESGYQQFAPRLDFVIDSFQGDFNIEPADHPAWKTWAIEDFRGTQAQLVGPDTVFLDGTAHVTTDKMARFRHCVANRPGGGATLTVARPGGTTDTFTLPQAIPTGAVKVIFQDVMYDPPKREGYSPQTVTWHWDGIQIS